MYRLTNTTTTGLTATFMMLVAAALTVGCDVAPTATTGTASGTLVEGAVPPAAVEGAVDAPAYDTIYSPDGAYVAFIADLDETGRFDLYVNALVAGAMPFRLTPNMVAGGDVMMLQWLPDSKRIAFLGDHNVDNDVSAFVVNVDGTHLVQLNPTLAAEGDVYAMAVVGDGEWMVFAADGETNGVTGYYAVHTDGVGDWIALAGPPSAVSPLVWWFNPDGSITIANNGDGAAWTVELEYLPAAIVALAPPAPPARGDMN